MEVSDQLHDPAALPRGKSTRFSGLRGPENRSGRCGEEKNLALPGIESGPYWKENIPDSSCREERNVHLTFKKISP
jgi:hypothetical protein